MEDLKEVAKFNVEGCLTADELNTYNILNGKLKSINDSREYLESIPSGRGLYIPRSIYNWDRERIVNVINAKKDKFEFSGKKLTGKIVKAKALGSNGKDYGDVLIDIVWSSGARTGMKLETLVSNLMKKKDREFTCNKELFKFVRRFWNRHWWLNYKLGEKENEVKESLKVYEDKFKEAKKAHKLTIPISKQKIRAKSLMKNITRVEAAKRIKQGADSLLPEEKEVMLNWFRENISAIRVYAEENGTSAEVLEKCYPSNVFGSPKLHPANENSSDSITTHISLKTLDNMPKDIIYKVSNKADVKDIIYKDSKRINNIWLALYLLDELNLKMNIRY